MTERIAHICSVLPRVSVFADVGCDHGYMAQYVLRQGLAETVYISDVSAGSLKKAEALLRQEIAEGRCVPVLADGMKGLPQDVGCLLIAGLGGEEIVRILKEGYLPPKFVLQPMKNSEKVRAYLVERGAKIDLDYTFGEGYYYDLIAGENSGGSEYSDWEIAFGRDNLKAPSPPFLNKLAGEREKLKGYLARTGMQRRSREEILRRLSEIEVIENGTQENL